MGNTKSHLTKVTPVDWSLRFPPVFVKLTRGSLNTEVGVIVPPTAAAAATRKVPPLVSLAQFTVPTAVRDTSSTLTALAVLPSGTVATSAVGNTEEAGRTTLAIFWSIGTDDEGDFMANVASSFRADIAPPSDTRACATNAKYVVQVKDGGASITAWPLLAGSPPEEKLSRSIATPIEAHVCAQFDRESADVVAVAGWQASRRILARVTLDLGSGSTTGTTESRVPDGALVHRVSLVSGGRCVVASTSSGIFVFGQDGALRSTLPAASEDASIVPTNDLSFAVFDDTAGSVKIWNLESSDQTPVFELKSGALSVAAGCGHIYIADNDGAVAAIDYKQARKVWAVETDWIKRGFTPALFS